MKKTYKNLQGSIDKEIIYLKEQESIACQVENKLIGQLKSLKEQKLRIQGALTVLSKITKRE